MGRYRRRRHARMMPSLDEMHDGTPPCRRPARERSAQQLDQLHGRMPDRSHACRFVGPAGFAKPHVHV